MTSASLDRLLAILLLGSAATGLLTLRAGSPGEAWVFVVHSLAGGVLLVAVGAKLVRSVPRAVRAGRRRRLALGALLTALTLGSIVAGFASVASGSLIVIGPWTLVTWHVVAGIGLAAILALHLLPRRWRLLRPGRAWVVGRPGGPGLSRRGFLVASLFGVAGTALWAGANALDQAVGGVRRFTGSRWLPAGGIPPATTFFGEGPPAVDPAAWRVRVHGAGRSPATYDLTGLAALGVERRTAVLDCTSGWAIETDWEGVALGRLLAVAEAVPMARRVLVRSATGWTASLGLEEAAGCLLATAVAGAPLPLANGSPVRLVVPGRRGLDWVKWVDEIEVRTD